MNLKCRYSGRLRGGEGRRGGNVPVRGTAGEGASPGHWWAFLPRVTAPVCDDFGIPGFQFAVPHHPTHVSLPTPPVLPWSVRKSDGSSGASGIVFRSGGLIAVAFRKDSPLLKNTVNEFIKQHREGTQEGNILRNRYIRDFDWTKNALAQDDYLRFSKLRPLFEKYGKQYNIEYLMIAAQAYQESRLDQNARSRAGAEGVMQIKPGTAADSNVNIRDIHKVEANIHAGVKYLDFLRRRYFSAPEIDELNQILLAQAAYNIGPGRMIKLRNSARTQGYDPNIWFDNVELAAAKDIGREPVQYVANIYKYYLAYRMSSEQVMRRKTAREAAGIN